MFLCSSEHCKSDHYVEEPLLEITVPNANGCDR